MSSNNNHYDFQKPRLAFCPHPPFYAFDPQLVLTPMVEVVAEGVGVGVAVLTQF
jgi:hypothetical protein